MSDKQPMGWIVSIERFGETDRNSSARAQVFDGADNTVDYGYADDDSLGLALASAFRGVCQGDENPWSLAAILNMLDVVAHRFQGDQCMADLGLMARAMWESLSVEDGERVKRGADILRVMADRWESAAKAFRTRFPKADGAA